MKTSKSGEHMLNQPTLASMHSTCQEQYTRHPFMYKTVYIIPEKRFARIVGALLRRSKVRSPRPASCGTASRADVCLIIFINSLALTSLQ